MNAPEVRTPGGNRASAKETTEKVVSLPTPPKTGNGKTGRTRYLRFFSERIYFLIEHLSDREVVAFMRLSAAYVVKDGNLPADDKSMATITKTAGRWSEFRDKLIALGLGRVEGNRWIDDDQQANLDIQHRVRERASKGASARWGGRHA